MLDLTKVALKSILHGFPHPTMVLDNNFNILDMNRSMEALTGRNIDDVCGVGGEFILCTSTGNERGQMRSAVIESMEPVTAKGDMINAHRQKTPIQYTIAPLYGTPKKLCAFLVTIEDLSEYTVELDIRTGSPGGLEIIGHSPQMQKVLDFLPILSQTDASVMITGETGTGKDKIAEIIHKKSSRARHPFVKVNCGALPAGLLESELFGHVKGAFTGATRDKPGMFKLADKGTLFLTEIGDMELPLQVKLLSVLDDREFVPVGGDKKETVDVRIIAATHRPLREQIRLNKFREDLFYRLHVLHVHLPPLRERDGDVRYLIEHFTENFAKNLGKTTPHYTKQAIEAMLSYPYPGNIRELRNIVEYAVNICGKKNIGQEFLPPYVLSGTLAEDTLQSESDDLTILNSELPVAASGTQENLATSPLENLAPLPPTNKQSWGDIERNIIVECLKKHDGSRIDTAHELGWGRMKLWRKMKRYELL